MDEMPETAYARGRAGSIAYQVIGRGALDLVFVHGVSHVEAQWQEPHYARFLRRLASFSRLLLFDMRGVGLSDPVTLSSLPTLEEWADDVNAVLDAVGSARTALLGTLDGGPMSIYFAAAHPQQPTK
ncbi:MAG: alpha/beta hydrolase [Actinomycetota bacterium]|nr:alpha/beta hydrolase [Actinomycetota bacterium]